jgi:UDP-GlcNAc:undecaprenyl-phosphate GlcNAc-1-phosphate transferase
VYGARWAYILLASFLISFGLTPLIIRLAHFLRVFDFPAARKVHAEPTPLLGGLAIYLAFVISILANSIFDQQVLAILLGGELSSYLSASWMTCVGFRPGPNFSRNC